MVEKVPAQPDFFDKLQQITEALLTHRRRVKRRRLEKQAKKNIIVDWLEAFIWAASVVLLINQYFLQAYQIPSGSMIDTLLIGDRIIVNKLIYGPELLPGFCKLPSPVQPERGEVIIFESPTYISRGTVFDIAQRIIYMLTFTIVDIDRDEFGFPKAHFLIKRAAGMGGDRLFNKNGNIYLRFAGEDRIVSEQEYNARRGWKHNVRRLVKDEAYDAVQAAVKADMWINLGCEPPSYIKLPDAADIPRRIESDTYRTAQLYQQRTAFPHEERFRARYFRKKQGWYVPPNRIMPLGDNRDSSLDGRSFGPVRKAKVLGQGFLIWWPGRAVEDAGKNAPPLNPPPEKQSWRRIGRIR
ncbi:MAG: S26 family signal peptidase [Spirochaetaceae bacterium]|jgi:signal peptidase I|nr:S26 family signal peptidase [Spirochaetaceae bacterium]